MFRIEAKWGLQLQKEFGCCLTQDFDVPACYSVKKYGEEAVSRTSMSYLTFFLSAKGLSLIKKCAEMIDKIAQTGH